MARVLIVGDERKGRVRDRISALRRWLDERGHDSDVELDIDVPLADREGDLVVVLGGDGSMLSAVRRMGDHQRPTLGINLGRLGFLTAFGDEEMLVGVETALAGQLTEEPRLMLSCVVRDADGTVKSGAPVPFLNDAVLSARSSAGIVRIVATRGDRDLGAYTGDGLIVATPVGSTAYSLAAGGPILSPRLDAMVLTPLASHSISLRPLVVQVLEGLELEVTDAGNADSCALVLDGQVSLVVEPGDSVCISPADMRFRHLTRGPANFFSVLREKFGWADEPRSGTSESQSEEHPS